MNIVFPEFHHPTIQEALARHAEMRATGEPIPGLAEQGVSEITTLEAPDLATACQLVKSGQADAMIAGIDYPSRDVILACKEHFSLSGQTFSGLTVLQREREIYFLADMAACKHPTTEQLVEIVHQTHAAASKILSTATVNYGPEPDRTPRIALLSFSTAGSGGHDDTITLMQSVRDAIHAQSPEILVDGEMQLDAAINLEVGHKKFPGSPVAGRANVLIAPDLNSGNLLYKAFEQLAGFHAAGPILQGFNFPVSDLSRGSSVADIILTMEVMAHLVK